MAKTIQVRTVQGTLIVRRNGEKVELQYVDAVDGLREWLQLTPEQAREVARELVQASFSGVGVAHERK